jgi:hypothetical protein
VEATYWASVKIPGVNARISQCGFLSLPCLVADEEVMEIHAAHQDAGNGKISFFVPLISEKQHLPLKAMSITLPFPELPDALPNEFSKEFDLHSVDEKSAQHVMPVWLSSRYRALGGTLTLSGAGYFSPNEGLPNELASNNWDPPYIFYPRNRFAGYGDNGDMTFPLLQALKAPYPRELEGMETMYRAEIYGGWVDKHWIEQVDISAQRKKGEECFLSDLQYQILWADGKLISYREENSDPRSGHCKQWRRALSFDDEGKVISFDDSIIDMLNGGTHVDYRLWNSACSTAPQQPGPSCTIAPPTTDQVSVLLQSSRSVRQWFSPSKILQQRKNPEPS